jgi:hypothetical protein
MKNNKRIEYAQYNKQHLFLGKESMAPKNELPLSVSPLVKRQAEGNAASIVPAVAPAVAVKKGLKIIKSTASLQASSIVSRGSLASRYKQMIKGLVGPVHSPALNSNTILHYNTKSVVYSFNKVNNLYPLLTKTEYLLKSLFRSMYSLISKPVYLLKHDKIIIRLFVFLSPKYDKFLDTSTRDLRDSIFRPLRDTNQKKDATVAADKKMALILKKLKKLRATADARVEILLEQMHHVSRKHLNHINLYEVSKTVATKEPENKQAENPLLPPNLLAGDKRYAGAGVNSPTGRGGIVIQTEVEGLSNTRGSATSLVSNFKKNLERLSMIFEKIFNKKVEFEIIKAQLPFQDSNILAQILGYNANKYKFRRMLKILIPRAVIKNPSKVFINHSPLVDPLGARQSTLLRGQAAASLSSSPASIASRLKELEKGLGTLHGKETEGVLGAKNLKMLLSQPSSYLPPSFYSKYNLSLPL